MNEKKRIVYLDLLNIISCIAVVFMHCNWEAHYFSNNKSWYISMIIETICYFAVPSFLMITGANLLDYRKKYNDKTYFKKRFFKVVIPYFIWSIIFYLVYFKKLDILDFINKFINCNIESIFWFFPMIIWLYLIIPVLSVLIDNNKEKYLYYLGTLIFITTSCICFLLSLMQKNIPSFFLFFDGYIGYLLFIILGYFFNKNTISKKIRIVMYILCIASLLFRFFHTSYYSLITNQTNKSSWGYLTILSVIVTSAIFIFLKNININFSNKTLYIITKISSYSFGVYLIHILVRNRITNLLSLDAANIKYKLLFPILVYFVSIIIVYIIKKIPLIKKIVP